MFATRKQTCLVFYDGVCGLCDRAVHFLLVQDATQAIKFAPLQGETARNHSQLPPVTDSIVLIVDPGTIRQQTHLRSDAMLRLLDHIGGFWRVVSWLRIVPRPIRDSIYDAVAKRRYRWFGRFDVCRIPPTEFRDRFLP